MKTATITHEKMRLAHQFLLFATVLDGEYKNEKGRKLLDFLNYLNPGLEVDFDIDASNQEILSVNREKIPSYATSLVKAFRSLSTDEECARLVEAFIDIIYLSKHIGRTEKELLGSMCRIVGIDPEPLTGRA